MPNSPVPDLFFAYNTFPSCKILYFNGKNTKLYIFGTIKRTEMHIFGIIKHPEMHFFGTEITKLTQKPADIKKGHESIFLVLHEKNNTSFFERNYEPHSHSCNRIFSIFLCVVIYQP